MLDEQQMGSYSDKTQVETRESGAESKEIGILR